jgi:GNAT superfamily N-acetyltransferase
MPDTQAVSIRPATCDEARAIATVHIASWGTTYRGIGIDDFVDSQNVDDRAAFWARILCDPAIQSYVYVAEVDGQIVGFASGGPERTGDPEYKGELYAIYLLQSHQGKGIGRKLLQAVAQRLAQSGLTTMLIWVLAVNPACFFYEACGGRAVRRRPFEFGGKTFDEIGYGWLDTRPAFAGSMHNDSTR